MFELKTENLTKIYKRRKVVNDVSFRIKEGEVVGLLGTNGAGKTTSFYMTVGLIVPDKGKIFINEKNITRLPMYKRAKMGIGYLPQENSVFRKLTVEENVMAILEVRGHNRKEIKSRCHEILKLFNVLHVSKQYGYTLSGGERRRVEIARALAGDPKILLLDEPFAGIDPIAIKDIQSIIEQIKKINIGVLITDHNVRETLKIVSRAYIMSEGKILVEGSSKKISKSKIAKDNYLGKDFKLF